MSSKILKKWQKGLIKQLGFADKSKQEMIETYYSIYSKERVLKEGVVIFRIKRL